MSDRRNLAVVSALLAVLLSQSILISSQEVEDEVDFSYEAGSEKGPEHWGEIHEDWAACGKGRMQSPIDLAHERVRVLPELGPLRRHYRPGLAILKNRGHDIMLKWEEEGAAGALWINGTAYNLKQLHWHSPSEHTINGNRYAMEMHMVHESADKKIAVVGILYSIGGCSAYDPFLLQLEKYITRIADRHEAEEAVGMVNAREMERGTWKYYRYIGSLTTPPCTEGVTWTIMREVRRVSKRQVELLRSAVHDESEMNSRPVQEINHRIISFFRPGRKQH